MFEAFPAQILTFFEKTFCCLILSQAITLEPICGSAFFPLACPANAPLLDCRRWLPNFTLYVLYWYTVIQDFEFCDHKDFKRQLNTCHVLPLWQISAKTSSPLKFILLDGLILQLQFQKLHWPLGYFSVPWARCFGHILISPQKFWKPMTTWNLSVRTQAWMVK